MKEMAHCAVCGEPMGLKHLIGKRKTCSNKCKQKLYRLKKKTTSITNRKSDMSKSNKKVKQMMCDVFNGYWKETFCWKSYKNTNRIFTSVYDCDGRIFDFDVDFKVSIKASEVK